MEKHLAYGNKPCEWVCPNVFPVRLPAGPSLGNVHEFSERGALETHLQAVILDLLGHVQLVAFFRL